MKIVNIMKKAGVILTLWSISLMAFADTAGGSGDTGTVDFFTFVKRILTEDLQPLLHIATTISYFIGLCLILMGLTRLYRHGQNAQSMMYRVSPAGTAMYFLSGIVLISFMPHLQMLSNSIFHLDPQGYMMHKCAPNVNPMPNPSDFSTSSNDFCPMEAYSAMVPTEESTNAIGDAIKYLMFGVLFLVGIISFIRGMVQLVKIGEGGQGQTVGKALTHIFAGVVAINADSFYGLMQSILENNVR